MKPTDVDHVGCPFGLKHACQHLLANARERRGGRQGNGNPLHVDGGSQPLVHHPLDQLHRLTTPFVHIDMRIMVTRKHPVQGVSHRLSDIAMEIESGDNRHACPHHLPDRERQVGFQIVNAVDHSGPMQREHDPINGLAVTKPYQDFLLELVVGPRLYRP